MARNIVILFDGTSNGVDASRTNVLRFYGVLEKSDRQLVYYDPGVGTFGADNAWSRLKRKSTEVWGLATGWGLDRNVKEAYEFLVRNYRSGKDFEADDGERDRIYILGFSRGAYTARVLAGFLHTIGLIEPRNLNLLNYAYRAYKRIGENAKEKAFAEVRLYERILRPDRLPIRMVGLFDTVASVIESGKYGPRLKLHASTSVNSSVEAVFHAVAIDERRTMFRPQLWPDGGNYHPNPFVRDQARPQHVEEVWFTGCHGDIGGGYPEVESGLCKVPLEWMIDRAGTCGLHFTARSVNLLVHGKGSEGHYVAPDGSAKCHNSMRGFWPVVEFIPRRKPKDSSQLSLFGVTLPLFERRNIPSGAMLHPSVVERWKTGKRSGNIPEDYSVWSDEEGPEPEGD